MRKPFDPAETQRLFHGTIEPLTGPLRPGGYDGVFWTAESSAVAQCYIPATGGSTYISVSSYQLDEAIRPSSTALFDIARIVGPVPYDMESDDAGRIRSWRVPENCVTYRKIVEYLENVLGYKNKSESRFDHTFEVLTDGWSKEAGHVIVPADYKRPGSLIILDGFQDMKFYDMSTGESDLTDLQYHKTKLFREAEASGYDGVIIDDFVQSKSWGNVGHRSIGFFQGSLGKLRSDVIPCVRFDWEDDLRVTETSEYKTWSNARAAQELVGAHSLKPASRPTVLER